MRISKLNDFCSKFALAFADISLLDCALTHPSYAKEHKLDRNLCYERLEFLGDAVLKTVISEFLFNNFQDLQEGDLTRHRALIVSDKTLADFAQKIELGDFILLSEGETRAGGAQKGSILACAFEALLGAIYLEGGIQAASNFVISNFKEEILALTEASEFSNPKALLQEYTQGKTGTLPEYILEDESGSAHNRTFQIAVYYEGEKLGAGTGKSKKEAEQAAAWQAMKRIEEME